MKKLKKFEGFSNTKVLILTTQNGDWEGLFINGELISEGHELGDGDILFILKMAEEYSFKSSDVVIEEVNDEDDEWLSNNGNFPENLSELKGKYI